MNELREVLGMVREGGVIAIIVMCIAAWKWVVYPYLRERDEAMKSTLEHVGDRIATRFDSLDRDITSIKTDVQTLREDVHLLTAHGVTRSRIRTIPPTLDIAS